ncbi:MAG: sugar phosphorylase [Bacteroidales bacterium]|nr:sugar phosphorylase [Bacteroidales bacterium]
MLNIKLKAHLDKIYGANKNDLLAAKLSGMARDTKTKTLQSGNRPNEADIVLITYGDTIKEKGRKPLQTLNNFLLQYLHKEITHVHILPFFPYSSDDGFSVIDYFTVDPQLGDWQDICTLSENFSLMFDLVINHISQHSQWFQNYLNGRSPGNGFFIEANPETDYSQVIRPRSLPLLTEHKVSGEKKHIWTTFSADQIDLNFKNPDVLIEIVKVFLFYLEQGAKIIRLDAIAFLWKEPGTNCLHLPQTHEVVKLLRTLAGYVDPSVIILTETNVPNKENLSYFGQGDEAQMVYQFSLPPLLLYTLYSGNSEYLTRWAQSLPEIPHGCTYFNFTASHDGIGVRPLEGLIPAEKLNQLIEAVKKSGGYVSTRQNSDGTHSAYELNITYFDALRTFNGTIDGAQEKRFICSQIIMMALKGVPAFYIHSLLATANYSEGVMATEINRAINRRKLLWDEITGLLEKNTQHAHVLNELKRIIAIRKSNPNFHPNCSMEIAYPGPGLFVLSRNNKKLWSVSNISNSTMQLHLGQLAQCNGYKHDIISGKNFDMANPIKIEPYQTLWLE